MKNKILIEICVDSIKSALAAQQGGADRIELCDNLIAGGTTPSVGMIELARKYLNIDINVIIRPRSGDFCYSDFEFEVIKKDIEMVKKIGCNGIVIGILKPDGEIDVERMKEIIELARPLSVTFHRAFDMTKDPLKAVNELIDIGVDRILTSGQENRAEDGIDMIRELVQIANERIIIMPGAGINKGNAKNIVNKTDVKEIHMSAKEKVDSIMKYRNSKVNMGGNIVISEYDNYFTNSQTVKAVRESLV